MADEIPKVNYIWPTISKALGAEFREGKTAVGLSGIEHRFDAIAVDDATRRVILFSSELNPKIAALTQVDVQSAMPDLKVLMARPLAFDLSILVRAFFRDAETAKLDFGRFMELGQR